MRIEHESSTPSRNQLKNFEPGMCVQWQNKFYIITAWLTGINLENGSTLDGNAMVEITTAHVVIKR